MTNNSTLRSMRCHLARFGVTMTDEQFSQLTYKELKTILRKSAKAYKLYSQVDTVIMKKEVQTPKIPLEKNNKIKA